MYVKLKSGRLEFSRVTAILAFSSFDLRETILVGPGAVARLPENLTISCFIGTVS